MKKYCFVILVALLTGCAGLLEQPSSGPAPQASASNESFDMTISPIYEFGRFPIGFKLSVVNKTEKDLEIDWNRTSFVDNGSSRAGFMFEGIRFADRNNPKQPDFVFAKGTFTKDIFPTANVEWNTRISRPDWTFKELNSNCGVSLSVKADGKEVRQNVILPSVAR